MKESERSIISIQSLVSTGYVGNNVAGFAIQLHGLNIVVLPTVMLSSHTDQKVYYGEVIKPELFEKLTRGISEIEIYQNTKYLLTGYIRDNDLITLSRSFISNWKELDIKNIYVYDPVFGDSRAGGLYIPQEVADYSLEQLLPLADVITPNQFELEYILKEEIKREEQLLNLINNHPQLSTKKVVLTSAILEDTPDNLIEVILIADGKVHRFVSQKINIELVGTGDLFASILTSQLALGRGIDKAIEVGMHFLCSVLEYAEAAHLPEMDAISILQAQSILEVNVAKEKYLSI